MIKYVYTLFAGRFEHELLQSILYLLAAGLNVDNEGGSGVIGDVQHGNVFVVRTTSVKIS